MVIKSTLKSPFGTSDKLQQVVMYIELNDQVSSENAESKDKYYNVWFAASPFATDYLLIVRMVTRFNNDVSTLIKHFSSAKKLTMKDSVLSKATLLDPLTQFWYVALNSKPGQAKVTNLIEIFSASIGIVKTKENKGIGFFDYNTKNLDTFLAHLTFDAYMEFFSEKGSLLLVSEPYFILQQNDMVVLDGNDIKWRAEDAPASYVPLLKQLLKAEALRAMGNALGSFTVQLPFSYGNMPNGFPVLFYKQNDVFSGVVQSQSGGSDTLTRSNTTVTINSLISYRDALRATSVPLSKLWTTDALSLKFDFVNPVISEVSDYYHRFDWRRCCTLDVVKLSELVVSGNFVKLLGKLSKAGVKTIPLLAFNPTSEIIELSNVAGFSTDLSVYDMALFDTSGDLYNNLWSWEYLDRTAQGSVGGVDLLNIGQSYKKDLINLFTNMSDLLDSLHFDEYLFELEIRRLYSYVLSKRITELAEGDDAFVTQYNDVQLEIIEVTEELRSLQEEVLIENSVVDAVVSEVTLSDKIAAAISKLEGLQIYLLSELGLVNTGDSKQLFWLKNIIPLCSGVREADWDGYSELLYPQKIFSNKIASYSESLQNNLRSLKFSDITLEPLLASELKLEGSIWSKVTRLVEFIGTLKSSLVPYASDQEFNIGNQTIDNRRK